MQTDSERIKELEAKLAEVGRERDGLRMIFERGINDDSDSIVASCGCLTKTPDPQYHKKGCKFRLIMERDSARAERDQLQAKCAEMEIALKRISIGGSAQASAIAKDVLSSNSTSGQNK